MRSDNPFFSIVIPTFNSEKVIGRCLDSIVSQCFQNYEVVIVDGLSNDKTTEIVKGFASVNSKIKLFSQKDKGTYDAMNRGIDLSTGDWICFLGSDDELYDSNVLDIVSETPVQADEDVIYGNAIIIGDSSWAKNGDVYDGRFDFAKLLRKNICHQAIFYRRSFLNTFGLRYNLSYPLLADWDLNLQCFAKTKFRYTDTIISKFFAGGQSTVDNQDVQFSKDYLENIFRYFQLLPFDKRLEHLPTYFWPTISSLQRRESLFRYYFEKARRKMPFKGK